VNVDNDVKKVSRSLLTIANTLVNGVDPFLLGAWFSLVVPGFVPGPRWKFVVFSVAGLAIAVGIAEMSKAHSIWPGNSGFPSGHETFGACIAAALYRAHARLLPGAVIACLLLGWSLMACGYHRFEDVVGGLALGSLVTGMALRIGLPGEKMPSGEPLSRTGT
jgi:membrane-associated phospholipid phosphatase